jgi:hypothetical protein
MQEEFPFRVLRPGWRKVLKKTLPRNGAAAKDAQGNPPSSLRPN